MWTYLHDCKVGAIVQEDISGASTIFGVKEVPPRDLIPNKVCNLSVFAVIVGSD